MYSYKEDCLRRRNVRQGLGFKAREPRRLKRKRVTKKPWKVMAQSILNESSTYCIYKGTTEIQCKNWIAKQKRSYSVSSKLTDYMIIGPENGGE